MTKNQEKEMLHQQGLRKCSRCLEVKAEAEFSKHKKGSYGLNAQCKKCASEAASAWNKANRDRCNETARIRWAIDPEPKKAACARWRSENQEARREAMRAWKAANPERVRELSKMYNSRRRARMRDSGVFSITARDERRLMDGPCYHCGAPAEHIDHIIPVARGGSHGIGNLAPMCAPCNLQKNSKLYVEFRYTRKAR